MLEVLTNPEAIDAQVTVTQDIFRTMAGVEVEYSSRMNSESSRVIDSLLRYFGSVPGSIVLECSINVARGFASRVLDIPVDLLEDSDIKDAMGELVNMIGGNLKALLPGDTTISIPMVFVPPYESLPLDISVQISSLDFFCEFGHFRLSLYGT